LKGDSLENPEVVFIKGTKEKESFVRKKSKRERAKISGKDRTRGK